MSNGPESATVSYQFHTANVYGYYIFYVTTIPNNKLLKVQKFFSSIE